MKFVFSLIPVTAARNKCTGLGHSTASAVLLVFIWNNFELKVDGVNVEMARSVAEIWMRLHDILVNLELSKLF